MASKGFEIDSRKDLLSRFTGTEPATLLVVDDSAFQRSRLRDLLENAGYEVLEAESGDGALEKIDQHEVDLVLLDVVMPGKDGYRVCEHIKNDPSTRLIPIIMVTSLQSREDKIRGIEVGADEYLRKPWSSVELLTRVRSLLRSRKLLGELERAENVISALVKAIEAKDPSAVGHSERVATLAARMGRTLRLKDEDIGALVKAGRLHDVGKIGISDAVLLKPGPLTPEEKKEVERHPVVGEEICRPLHFAGPVLDVIRHHHERVDGSGYPDGLSGKQVGALIRILGLVDAFDAMVSERLYRSAMKMDEAMRILKESRKQWDRDVLQAFESVLGSTSFTDLFPSM